MDEQAIKQYLKDNLSIELELQEEYGPTPSLSVKVKLGDDTITTTEVDLPTVWENV